MGNLDNCSECNKLFVRTVRAVCPDCSKKYEEKFQTVHTFVRKKENRMALVTEVSEATGVSVSEIYQFIREGRLNTAHFPNLTYPCESCSSPIKEGRICQACQQRIRQGMELVEKEKELDRNKEYEEKNRGIYHSKNRFN